MSQTSNKFTPSSGLTFTRRTVLGGTVAVAVAGLASPGIAAPQLPLVGAGGATATVVVADTADDQTAHAATTLVDYVAEATGVRLPIVAAGTDVTGPQIVVGTTIAGSGVTAEEVAALAADAYLLRRTDDVVTIAGSDGWGTRFGVYEFLERHLDVRWLMPDGVIPGQVGDDVPQRTSLSVGALDRTDAPAFACRIMHPFPVPGASSRGAEPWLWDWTSSSRPWQARDMITWGRQARVHESLEFMHNLSNVISPAKYGDPDKAETYRPEFFPIIDGETYIPPANRPNGWQPRFSADGVAEAAADWAIDFLRSNPDVTSYSLAVNDGLGYSEDDEEPGVVGSNGRPTASNAYYAFVNAVASKVAHVFPHALCGVIAYNEVIDPPTFALDEHVVPVLVVPTYRWMDPAHRAADQQWVESWAAKADRLGWWDRLYGFPFCVPHMYLTTIADTLRYLRTQNVTAILAETRSANQSWGEGPKMAIYADLLWNPDLDPRRLTHGWCVRAVGPEAGPHLEAYYRLWERFWLQDAPQTDWFAGSSFTPSFRTAGYLEGVTDNQIGQARRHIDNAVAATSTPEQSLRMDVLSRDFAFYEASALSYPKHVPAPVDNDQATDMFDRAADRLDRDLILARNRLVLADHLTTGGPDVGPRRYDQTWTGWNLYAAWGVAEQIRRAPLDDSVRRHVLDRMGTDASPNIQLLGQMVLELADGNTVTPISNGSFDAGTDDWILNASAQDVARVSISTDVAHSGDASLRLPDGYVGGVMQTVPVHPGFFRLHAHLYVPGDTLPRHTGVGVGRGQYASLLTEFYDADGRRVHRIRDVFSLEPAVGTWHQISQSDMIDEGIVSARVRVIVDTVGPVHVDDIAVVQTIDSATMDPWFTDTFDDIQVGELPLPWLAILPRTAHVETDDVRGHVLTASVERPDTQLDIVRPFAPIRGRFRISFALRLADRTRHSLRFEESDTRRPLFRLRAQGNTFLYWDGNTWANSFHAWTPGSWIDVAIEADTGAGTYTLSFDGTDVGTGRLDPSADHLGKLWITANSPAGGGDAFSIDRLSLQPLDQG